MIATGPHRKGKPFLGHSSTITHAYHKGNGRREATSLDGFVCIDILRTQSFESGRLLTQTNNFQTALDSLTNISV